MKKILCKLGFHKPVPIGEAPYPYDITKTLIGMGCKKCGKKLSKGYVIPNEKLKEFYSRRAK